MTEVDQNQGVAVGLRPGGDFRSDVAGGAGAVLDDDLLSERLRQTLAIMRPMVSEPLPAENDTKNGRLSSEKPALNRRRPERKSNRPAQMISGHAG